VDRRTILRATGAMAVAPLAGGDPDPDELFRTGRFDAADRGYRRILRTDPDNAHATARRGYIALLSNRFVDSERFLRRAVDLAPTNNAVRYHLADTYVRQDNLATAAPLLRQTGRTAIADQFAGIVGRPYRIDGPVSTSLPWRHLDPLPVVDVAVNGVAAPFLLDTGATLVMTRAMAERVGARAISTQQVDRGNGQIVTVWFGVVDRLGLGALTLHNVPIVWNDLALPTVPDADEQPQGVLGTTLFYHFRTTLDYARRQLVLRRPARDGRAGTPFWLAPDHFLYSWGRVGALGPGIVGLDTGGPGLGVVLREENAGPAGVVPDRTRPRTFFGVTVYPCVADEVALGGTVRRQVPGVVGPVPSREATLGFASLATITHEFLKPFALTFDFVGMRLSVTTPK
jgi:hypothetical protein